MWTVITPVGAIHFRDDLSHFLVSMKVMGEVLGRGAWGVETMLRSGSMAASNIGERSRNHFCGGKAMGIRGQLKCDGTRAETRFRLCNIDTHTHTHTHTYIYI